MTTTGIKPQTGTWTIDANHSNIGFAARHLMTTKVRGTFTSFSGTIEIGDEPTDSTVSVSIDTPSVDTGTEDRDAHLRSPDFFDTEVYPTATFTSTSVDAEGGDRYVLTGDLTIKDVTRPVSIEFEYLGTTTDPWGNDKIAFEGSTVINREDWGLNWNAALETGGVLVSKKITIELEVQAAKAS